MATKEVLRGRITNLNGEEDDDDDIMGEVVVVVVVAAACSTKSGWDMGVLCDVGCVGMGRDGTLLSLLCIDDIVATWLPRPAAVAKLFLWMGVRSKVSFSKRRCSESIKLWFVRVVGDSQMNEDWLLVVVVVVDEEVVFLRRWRIPKFTLVGGSSPLLRLAANKLATFVVGDPWGVWGPGCSIKVELILLLAAADAPTAPPLVVEGLDSLLNSTLSTSSESKESTDWRCWLSISAPANDSSSLSLPSLLLPLPPNPVK